MAFEFEKFRDNSLVLWNNSTETSVNVKDLNISEEKLRKYLKENPMPEEDNYFENDLIHDLTCSTGAFLIPDGLYPETIEYIKNLIDKINENKKRYVAVFKIYNGEATYNILVKTEAKNKKDAKGYFKMYECNTNVEIWKFVKMKKVEVFEDLWCEI